jgi:carbon-monoxide dehydrogenase medium subunit
MLGSLAYAHPAAEWPVVAILVGAQLDLIGPDGQRTVAAEHFFTGPFTTARRPEELLAEVRLPVLPPGTGAGFAEHRPADAKFAEVARSGRGDRAGRRGGCRLIGLVNAGPCPIRARAAEAAIRVWPRTRNSCAAFSPPTYAGMPVTRRFGEPCSTPPPARAKRVRQFERPLWWHVGG